MNARTWCALATALLVHLSLGAGSAAGQLSPPDAEGAFRPVRWEWGADFVAAKAVGQFSDYVDGGFGFGISGIRYLGDGTGFGLRLDLMLISYGKTTESYGLGLPGPDLDMDLTTENVIASLAVGPHFVFGRGRLRPYLGASVGSAQFVTTSSAWAGGQVVPIASTEVLERYALALAAGGGVRVTFRQQRAHPISVELDGRYRRHGRVEYLREGGVRELPDGSIELELIDSDANLWTLSIGALIGVR
ncbi:MAG TPA: hypothetical protein VK858_12770 [Longimicrobiales bacterium]|nr:hypothetical protein [Longimicrobiales bacterium]